ncbi:MAG: aminoacyl-histidine dipeptidase [Rikenellaceae bacterium]|nr:aminoacyl-histidine dipeptidase [Rikenellaceae bacterium]
MSEITSLEPRAVWHYFDEITRIPRPSKKEERIAAYLVDFAKTHNLPFKQDKTGNIVIRKAATPGMEGRPAVVLQSHMDMVCEKNGDTVFDFDTDPIRTRVEDGWVRAEGTTLGADDGIGMAAALAVLAAGDVPHGPLEALFTVDEETGLTGAFGLADDMLTGKYLINLDSEDEGELFIGCAGGIDTVATLSYKAVPVPGGLLFFRVDVSGLRGGHSGDDIDKGLANSNRVLARFLSEGTRTCGLRLGWFDGGNLRNAIPREAYAVFGVPVLQAEVLFGLFERFSADIKAEFHVTEPAMDLALSEMPAPAWLLPEGTQAALLDALVGLPNGVLAMSRTMPGLVETSSNLASVKFVGEDKITVTTSQRSSVGSALHAAAMSVEAVFRLACARVQHSDGYPGWAPDPDSYLLEVTREAYVRLFGTEPKVRAIHAGLECGLFLQKYPDLEMVSFGPTLRGVHSPDERLEIATVDCFWRLLTATLGSIAE